MVSLEPKKQKRQNLHYPFSPKSSHSTYQSRMTVLAENRPERTYRLADEESELLVKADFGLDTSIDLAYVSWGT